MKINKNRSTGEVMEEFKLAFPWLKIEFYKKAHKEYRVSAEVLRVKTETELAELNPNIKDGEVELSPKMTVNELETLLELEFGLHVQVYRKSGEQWMQTSITDNWTLEKQQDKSRELEDFKNKK